jgi:endonuclease/exonuclease/phosphatase family metal-dependent hydrolase
MKYAIVFLVALVWSSSSFAKDTVRIVSWNAQASLLESIVDRRGDITQLSNDLKPDVLVLVEVAGRPEAKVIAESLGWDNYHLVMSDFGKVRDSAYTGLEVVVISKLPIKKAIEFDPVTETPALPFGVGKLAKRLPAVTEKQLTNKALPTLGTLTFRDRGTLRVDLENGLTIFPVHLKSNRNSRCDEIDKARRAISTQDADLAGRLKTYYENGFRKATDQHLKNARLRERMIASVLLEANKAVDEGRKVIITGDFNVSFEPGKSGSKHEDCVLKDFSCRSAPFPKKACQRGDGFDDTLAILEKPLVGKRSWKFLTREMTRTYKSKKFADLAIDHMVVPNDQASKFTKASKSDELYGSDHFALTTVFTP